MADAAPTHSRLGTTVSVGPGYGNDANRGKAWGSFPLLSSGVGSPQASAQPGPAPTTTKTDSGYEREPVGGDVTPLFWKAPTFLPGAAHGDHDEPEAIVPRGVV